MSLQSWYWLHTQSSEDFPGAGEFISKMAYSQDRELVLVVREASVPCLVDIPRRLFEHIYNMAAGFLQSDPKYLCDYNFSSFCTLDWGMPVDIRLAAANFSWHYLPPILGVAQGEECLFESAGVHQRSSSISLRNKEEDWMHWRESFILPHHPSHKKAQLSAKKDPLGWQFLLRKVSACEWLLGSPVVWDTAHKEENSFCLGEWLVLLS